MSDYVLEELAGSAEWRRVLEAYQRPASERRQASERHQAPSDDAGWLPRQTAIQGIDAAQLCQIHGKLIALGLLQVEISGKSGLQYQVSPLGRRTLDRGPAPDDESDCTGGPLDLTDDE